MRLAFRTFVALGAALCLAPALLADAREDFERIVPLSAGGSLFVENRNGSITIDTWNEGSVHIQAEKRARSQAALDDIEIRVEGSGDEVRLETIHHRSRNGGSVSYRILVPVETHVDTRTANGAVTVEGVRGRLRASSTNGSLKLLDVAGEIEAATTNGSIRASYREAGGGRHRFTTTNGSIRIYLPSGSGGEVEAETVNGSISVDLPMTVTRSSRRHLQGTFGGGGGGSFEVETVNGSVKLLPN